MPAGARDRRPGRADGLPGADPRAGGAAARAPRTPRRGARSRVAAAQGEFAGPARLPRRRRSARHPLAHQRAARNHAGARAQTTRGAAGDGRLRQRAPTGRATGGVRARGLRGGGDLRRAPAPRLLGRPGDARRRGVGRRRPGPRRQAAARAGAGRPRRRDRCAAPAGAPPCASAVGTRRRGSRWRRSGHRGADGVPDEVPARPQALHLPAGAVGAGRAWPARGALSSTSAGAPARRLPALSRPSTPATGSRRRWIGRARGARAGAGAAVGGDRLAHLAPHPGCRHRRRCSIS